MTKRTLFKISLFASLFCFFLGGVRSVGEHLADKEISQSDYSWVNTWWVCYEGVRPAISEAMEDNKITVREFSKLQKLHDTLYKRETEERERKSFQDIKNKMKPHQGKI